MGENGNFKLGGSKITADGDCSHEIKTLAPWKKSFDQPRQHIKKQRQILFSWAPKSLQMVTAAMKLEDTCSLEEKL